jgi:CDP-diglyceride synthetase
VTSRRSTTLHNINIVIGITLIIAGVAGGFLLTFWLLVVLLPLTCVAASWMMTFTARRARDVHLVATPILTGLFLLWLTYFLQNGAQEPTWYGIFLIWLLMMGQVAVYLAANRTQVDPANASSTAQS